MLLAAAFFGWLGYRLFSNVATWSSAEIGVCERFRAIFVQVGPGLFSSLFGAIIQVYSLVHPAVLEQWGFGDADSVTVHELQPFAVSATLAARPTRRPEGDGPPVASPVSGRPAQNGRPWVE